MDTSPVRVAVVGLARDCAARVGSTLLFIDSLANNIPELRCMIATNDNTDDTAVRLGKWARGNERAQVLELGGVEGKLPNRLERLAHVRNVALQQVRQLPSKFTHLLVIDMDGPNGTVVPRDVLLSIDLMRKNGWAGAFANQRTAYYDLLALRRPGWVDADVWQEVASASTIMRRTPIRQADRLVGGRVGRLIWNNVVERVVHRRQYRIPPSTPPIEVHSAFGGLALYDWSFLRGISYCARGDKGDFLCEHIAFNNGIRAKGGRLCIDPRLLNEAPPEHLGRGSGRRAPDKLGRRDIFSRSHF